MSERRKSTDAPNNSAFSLASSRALVELSVAITLEPSISIANVMAIQPEPAPMSQIVGSACLLSVMIQVTSSSVSGLGINTSLDTLNFLLRKCAIPVTCWIGSLC